MPNFTPPPDQPREQGRVLACEGILRSRFGHRPTEAASRAIERLQSEEEACGDPPVGMMPPDSISSWQGNGVDGTRDKVIIFPVWAKWTAAAACLMIGLFAGSLFFSPADSELRVQAGGQDAGVFVERAGQRLSAVAGLRVEPGDLILTATNASLTLAYQAERTEIALGSNTKLRLIPSKRGKRFELREGTLLAEVARQRWFHPMIVRTRQAEASVLGTRFSLMAMINSTRLDVTEGRVRFTRLSGNDTLNVSAGQYAVAAAGTNLTVHPVTGMILREFWLDLPGDTLQDLTYHSRYPKAPSGRDFPPGFETNTNWPGAFGTRMRGYLLPPVTGDYEFRVAGNGQMCLWLSPDDSPADRVKIAQIVFTRNRPGDEQPTQTHARLESGLIPLEAGRRYYIESTHKFGKGEDRLTVIWKRPNATEEPIPAEFLAPFIPPTGAK